MGVRHVQIFFGWSATTLGYIMRSDMPVAINAMVENLTDEGQTDSGSNFTFNWDLTQQSIILSSFFWLYMVLAVPSGRWAEKYGAKLILGFSIGLASLFTLLIPIVAVKFPTYAFYEVVVLRILNGFVQSAIYPTTNVLISRWVTPAERSRSLAICFSGGFFGPLIGNPLAGFMVDTRFGWASVFCATGGLGLIWTFLWMCYGNSSYQDSEEISAEEKAHIHEAIQSDVKIEHSSKTPWPQILTSLPVWAIVFSHFGFNYAYFFILHESPTYIHKVFQVNVKNSGLFTTLPFLMGCITLPVYSVAAHFFNKYVPMSPTAQRKVWNSITLWGGAAPLLLLVIFNVESVAYVMLLLIISVTLLTAEYYGYLTNHIHLSPNFGGTLLGISNFFATFGALLSPLFVPWIVNNAQSTSDWHGMFLLVAAVMFVANLVYIIFGSSELQSWNEVD